MSTRNVKLWQAGATEKAYRFSTLPQSDPLKRLVWIPKSQIAHISRTPSAVPGDWPECLVEIEEWLADKDDL
jgi:hypothetical protein